MEIVDTSKHPTRTDVFMLVVMFLCLCGAAYHAGIYQGERMAQATAKLDCLLNGRTVLVGSPFDCVKRNEVLPVIHLNKRRKRDG